LVAQNGKGTTLVEISRASGLHPSTAFHLLRTLVGLGYVVQDHETREYRLGSRVFQVAVAASTEAQLAETARPYLVELTKDTGETSHLAILERGEAVVVSRVEGASPLQVVNRVGSPRPTHCTAIGKVLLAALSEPELAAVLDRKLTAYTAKTITSPAELRRELARVKAEGHAMDDEEFAEGVRCIAAPVRNFTGRVVAAVGISGPLWRMTPDTLPALIETVKRAAGLISAQLGAWPVAARTDTPGPVTPPRARSSSRRRDRNVRRSAPR
jgi:IclR family acetate operon transcriptional repressor